MTFSLLSKEELFSSVKINMSKASSSLISESTKCLSKHHILKDIFISMKKSVLESNRNTLILSWLDEILSLIFIVGNRASELISDGFLFLVK